MSRRNVTGVLMIGLTAALVGSGVLTIGGCPPNGDPNLPIYNNESDPNNSDATYIGSQACLACHAGVMATVSRHAHSHALTPTLGRPPAYSPAGTRAGVPNPPAGKTWNDVSYVISGYLLSALFVDSDGYVMTDGVEGVNTHWALDHPASGITAGFVPYKPEQTQRLPYDYETCFRCHTTGPRPQDPADPRSQDGRPGILGTWAEAGVRCEACHGPGSLHAPNPQARNIFVDPTAKTCGRCHTAGDDPNVIRATDDGFINSNAQYPELLASGGHAGFACMICHDPHASITYDRDVAWRNQCTACHSDMNHAFHGGFVYRVGDYVEEVSCQSCHMPLAGKNTLIAPAGVFGDEARIAEVRSHIFRIDADNGRYTAMLSDDGTHIRKDAQGRAALTLDYVCLRCHNGAGNAFTISAAGAPQIARDMHANAEAAAER